MNKFWTVILAMCIGLTSVMAQTQVSGKVTDGETGGPLPGVSIQVKGTTTGVVSDATGKYSISAPDDATLVFTFIGMATQEIVVGGRTTIDLTMQPEASSLEEVVVVAYGTAKKGTVTGAVSVSSAVPVLKDLPVTSFENALQGTVSGVQVTSTNSTPGGQVKIRIRGVGSFNASNEPLYVVDGIPQNSGDYNLYNYGGSISVMSSINPADIENMTVLKDAAATALYGSRGANGVVLITTKKGKAGVLKINFKGSIGTSAFATQNRPVVGAEDQRMLLYEGAYNSAVYNGMSDADAAIHAMQSVNQYAPLPSIGTSYGDWIGALFQEHAQFSNYEINASGGNDKTTFFVSGAYRQQMGMVKTADFEGYSARASITHKANKWIVTADASIGKVDANQASTETNTGDVSYANPYMRTRTDLSPVVPIYNADGTFYKGRLLSGMSNLVEDMVLDKEISEIFRSNTVGSVSYEFIEGLRLKETLSFDMIHSSGKVVWPANSDNGETWNGLTQRQTYTDYKTYSSLLLTYDKTLFEDHTVNALIGWDVDMDRTISIAASANGFASTQLDEMGAAATPNQAYSQMDDDRLVSYFARLGYNYKSKYYFQGTYRKDGSSRFGSNTRWGDFWSVSASWRLKEENFLKSIQQIDDLKLRASYGVSGVQPRYLYQFLSTYDFSAVYYNNPASVPARVENPDLSWERNYTLDIGLEVKAFERLSVELDWYDKNTTDLLLDVPISYTTGFRTTLLNYGAMNNRGLEATIGYDVLKDNDFHELTWATNLILSHNKNKVVTIYDHKAYSSGNYLIKEGESRYSFRAREWAGVDPGTGDSMWARYKDASGNWITSSIDATPVESTRTITKDPDMATRRIIGHAEPRLTGGWRNKLGWRGIDLDFLFIFSLGGQSFDDAAIWTASDGYYPAYAISVNQLDRWQKPGDVAKNPRRMEGSSSYGNYTSSRWLHSSDYLRLKTLTFGYTLPQRLSKKAKIERARIYVAGTNLWTYAAYDDYDPEAVDVDGSTHWFIPPLKTWLVGIELGF